ncbi:hypothetical protein [Arthrobacter zhaoguopingii]|uniref:hypothetical protein n=1 Tax=Arthrobacter zhaoguopingii TaxID=2681491 RepID=UPI001357759E|nr:hypothetical protein [Arthrobacter zhaoguopingii]
MPYAFLRSTQFFEFVHDLVGWNTDVQGTVRLPSKQIQFVAVDDVVTALTGITTSTGVRRLVEIGGTDVFTIDEAEAADVGASGGMEVCSCVP